MRNLILIFAFALIILSCTQKTKTSPDTSEVNQSSTTLNTRIVFVDQDTLLEKYDLYQESKNELEEQSTKAQNTISAKLEAFQRKVQKFQQKVYETQQKAATIAPVELKKLEEKFSKEQESLGRQEQKLIKQRDEAAAELEKKILELQIKIKNKIDVYLNDLARDKNYDFVLIKGGAAGGVLYGNKKLDITDQVVSDLNKRHADGN